MHISCHNLLRLTIYNYNWLGGMGRLEKMCGQEYLIAYLTLCQMNDEYPERVTSSYVISYIARCGAPVKCQYPKRAFSRFALMDNGLSPNYRFVYPDSVRVLGLSLT